MLSKLAAGTGISLRRAKVWTGSLAAVGALLMAGIALADKPSTVELSIEQIDITAQPITSFEKGDSQRTSFGRLEWRGGMVLSSKSSNFGGWSGLITDPNGKSIFSVSDAGTWMTAELVYDGNRLTGVKNATLGPLQSLGSENLKRGRDRDAESTTLASGTLAKGSLLIGFEHNHRIGRFNIDDKGLSAPKSYITIPSSVKSHITGNKGLEAITVLKGGLNKGALVAIGEQDRNRTDVLPGWIWIKDEPKAFTIKDIRGFNATDVASLPDGGIILLERRYRLLEGVKMRLRRFKPSEVRPGAELEGEILFETDFLRHEIDNMEGLGLHEGPDREIILTLISDDNFNHFLQRTVLLQFALKGDGVAGPPTPAGTTGAIPAAAPGK